jgi:hypothetical protein
MLLEQEVVTPKYWSYALNSYIESSNIIPKASSNYNVSPLQAVTGNVPNIEKQFQYPFGTSVAISRKGNGKDRWKFSDKCEYGFVVGSSSMNGAVQVIISARNIAIVFNRKDVRLINLSLTPISNGEIRVNILRN